MCGIVGYIGQKQAQPILFNGLAKLEYRGYDSCGIALANHGTRIYKDAVRVDTLSSKLPKISAMAGIGHTRWATHGVPLFVSTLILTAIAPAKSPSCITALLAIIASSGIN